MDYQTENISVRLTTQPVQFDHNCLPVEPDTYQKFDQQFKSRAIFDIWEKSMPNSQGWLGVINDEGEVTIEGKFKTYTHTGPYSGLMTTCKSIANDNPDLTEFYCVYLNSPENTAEADLKCKIIFR